MPTSSGQEDKRFHDLKLLQLAGHIENLQRQVRFNVVINGYDVFVYTADFAYIERPSGLRVVEEFKGYIFERHDSLLRIKVCSALYPTLTFRVVTNKGLYRVYNAGKAIRQSRSQEKPDR